jgi:DNA-binding transcriptional LysR family regulator
MDFEQLRIFLVLAEERTFLGAANRLETSRSRVRRKLDQLEQDAGTALVNRGQTGLTLTPAGETLARRGRSLLQDARHLIAHVRDVGSEPTGCLPIAMPLAPSPAGWEEACQRALSSFPDLAIELLHAESPLRLLPARAELAVTFESETPHGCSAVPMGEYPMRLLASERYLSRFGVPDSPDALRQHRLAIWRRPDEPDDHLPLRDGRRLPVGVRLTSRDPRPLFRLTVDGECIAYLPALPSLDDPALVALFVDDVTGAASQQLVIPDIFADLPRVQRFVALCTPELPAIG